MQHNEAKKLREAWCDNPGDHVSIKKKHTWKERHRIMFALEPQKNLPKLKYKIQTDK